MIAVFIQRKKFLEVDMFRKFRILTKQSHPLRFLISRLLPKIGFCLVMEYFEVKIRLGKSKVSQTIYTDGIVNQYMKDALFFNKNLSHGDVYIDVGANIGTLACLAAKKVGAEGLCIAIEPHPNTFNELVANIRLNNLNIIAMMFAIGDRKEFVKLTDDPADDQNKVASEGVPVYMTRLDALLPEILDKRRIKLLKIDVEGYEYFVLKGAAKIIDKVDMIYFEISDRMLRVNNVTPIELLDLLRSYGFSIKYPNGELLPGLEKIQPMHAQNLLAVRN
jgi:FkbM family methyltransferase